VLNGKLELRQHSLERPFEYTTVQVIRPGIFLGAPGLDMGHSHRAFAFAVCLSH